MGIFPSTMMLAEGISHISLVLLESACVYYTLPTVNGAMGCGEKCFKLIWRCNQLLSGFLAKAHLAQVSRRSRLSTNVKGRL